MIWVNSFARSRRKAWFPVVILNNKTPKCMHVFLGLKGIKQLPKNPGAFSPSESQHLPPSLFIPSGFYFSIKRASSTGSSWSRHGLVFSQGWVGSWLVGFILKALPLTVHLQTHGDTVSHGEHGIVCFFSLYWKFWQRQFYLKGQPKHPPVADQVLNSMGR